MSANTCTCSNGTPAVATAGTDLTTLCETTGTADCSACNAGYNLDAAAASGVQTCVGMCVFVCVCVYVCVCGASVLSLACLNMVCVFCMRLISESAFVVF